MQILLPGVNFELDFYAFKGIVRWLTVCRKISCTISLFAQLELKANKASRVRHGEYIASHHQFAKESLFCSIIHSFSLHSFLRDSLQLQHSTNLNIQRSQSTSRFCGVLNTNFAAADDMYSHADSVSNYDDNNIPATSTSASAASASASASDSNYIFSATTDNEININWCPQLNQPPPFAQSATLYKDPNYNQITVMNDNESNQCSSGDYQNSLENARAQQFNANEAFASTTMSINDQNRERSHPNSSSLSMERCSIDTTQQRLNSITSEFDTIPSIENKDCEYLKLVMTFKRTLVLPDVFFSYDMVICYCALCLSNSGRNLLEGTIWYTNISDNECEFENEQDSLILY